jgi:small-conductance mechanosensitive channel
LKLGFDYNISGLLATSALITAIIGLAMQATLSNIIAGISLHVEQPFSIGDYVRVPERNIKSEGFIEAIRWRSIVIRRTDNSQVVIPNNQFAASMIEVLQKNQLIRAELLFSVAASIPPQKIDIISILKIQVFSFPPKV